MISAREFLTILAEHGREEALRHLRDTDSRLLGYRADEVAERFDAIVNNARKVLGEQPHSSVSRQVTTREDAFAYLAHLVHLLGGRVEIPHELQHRIRLGRGPYAVSVVDRWDTGVTILESRIAPDPTNIGSSTRESGIV